jgi:hypothetical protein
VNGTATRVFTGLADDCFVYDDLLTAGEVTTLYNSGDPPDLTSVLPANLIGYWLMGDGDTFPTLLDSGSGGNNLTMTNMEAGDLGYSAAGGVAITEVPNPGVGSMGLGPGGGSLTRYFKMRGRDVTCPGGQQPAYVYWVVQDAPDTGATQATLADLICGTDPLTDITEIEVAHAWQDDG